jgi:hypothetical protein
LASRPPSSRMEGGGFPREYEPPLRRCTPRGPVKKTCILSRFVVFIYRKMVRVGIAVV